MNNSDTLDLVGIGVSIMGTSGKILLTTFVGILTGLLVSSGHLDASNANAFQQDTETAGGLVISIISLGYLLEHLLVKLKSEIKVKTGTPTQVTVTTPTTTIETTEPAVQSPTTSSPTA